MSIPKTYGAMLKHIAHLQAQAEVMRKRESVAVIKRIKDAMAAYDLKPSDLMPQVKKPVVKKVEAPVAAPTKPASQAIVKPAAQKSKPRVPKYSDGQGHTWAGGGSLPVWLREQVALGKTPADFLVKPEEAA